MKSKRTEMDPASTLTRSWDEGGKESIFKDGSDSHVMAVHGTMDTDDLRHEQVTEVKADLFPAAKFMPEFVCVDVNVTRTLKDADRMETAAVHAFLTVEQAKELRRQLTEAIADAKN